MRLERLTANKIKIFLTSDDLFERGLSKEDIWKDSLKWHQLFHDMLQEASDEFDFDFRGAVAVEIFSLQAQGMVMIITVEDAAEGDEILYDGFFDMQLKVEGSDLLLYEFDNIEDIIQLTKKFRTMGIFGGSMYSLNGRYYFLFKDLEPPYVEKAASILSEYGRISLISPYVLEEYGNKIIGSRAVETIFHFFK